MSIFIHRENQEILWSVLHTHPLFIEFDQRFSGQKETWFRNTIGEFYESLPKTNVSETPAQLLEKNKRAIEFMMNDIKTLIHAANPSPIISPPNPMSIVRSTDPLARGYESYDVHKEKQRNEQEKQSMYSAYQSNYNSLFQRDVPKTVDFSEPINDGKIENMDSLIRQQQTIRDQDIARFAPIPTPDEIKHKLQGISATGNSETDIRFQNTVSDIIIQPPSSAEWSSYTTDQEKHYEAYHR